MNIDRTQLEAALFSAHKAGNAEHARVLANALAKLDAGQADNAPVTAPVTVATPTSPWYQRALAAMGSSKEERDRRAGIIESQGVRLHPGAPASVEESNGSRAALANGVRYAAPLAASMGGPAGAAASGGGELVAQMMEEGKVRDPGSVASATAVGAVPIGRIKGVIETLKNSGRMALGSAVGTEARSLVNNGTLADSGTLVRDAAVGGAIPLVAPSVGKVLAKGMGISSPEAIANAVRATADRKAKLDNAAKLIEAGGALPPADLGDASWYRNFQQTMAGKEHLAQQSSLRNEPVLRDMVRTDLGLKPGGPLAGDTIEAAQTRAMKPYEKVAALSENAANDFQALKTARGNVRNLEQVYRDGRGTDVGLLERIKAEKEKVNSLEDMLEAHAEAKDNPKLRETIDRYYAAQSRADELKSTFAANQASAKEASGSPTFREQSIDQVPIGAGNNSPDVALARAYDEQRRLAEGLKRRIEGRAVPSGAMPQDAPKLIQQMREGRKTYAKTQQLQDLDGINYGRAN